MLRIRDISKRLGGLEVLRDVSLGAEAGTITGIIGPNGAGKSTLFGVVSGFLGADAGSVELGGERVGHLPPHRRAARGLVRTFQVPREFGELTVLDNLRVAASEAANEGMLAALFRPRHLARVETEVSARADTVIDRLDLSSVRRTPARELSGGQKKLLELGRALMKEPRALLVDEPFAGVAPALSRGLAEHLLRLRAEGLCILIIEHDIDTIMEIADRVCVMVEGRILTEGPPEEVRHDPRVLDAYLGAVPA